MPSKKKKKFKEYVMRFPGDDRYVFVGSKDECLEEVRVLMRDGVVMDDRSVVEQLEILEVARRCKIKEPTRMDFE